MIIIELLNPKSDYVFKRIFGYTGNEEITKNFLQAITNEKIEKIELDCNPITEKNLLDDKVGILDIKAKLNDNTNCNIEMQVIDRRNIEKRILFYWSKLYTSGIKEGEEFSKLQKTIVILIIDYNLDNLKNIKKYLTKWKIIEEENRKIVLTNDLEIYIIEARKAKKHNCKNELDKWIKFINNPKENVDMGDKEIKKAKEVLEEISQDKNERYLAELRDKYIRDQKAIEGAGYDKGLKAGIERGIEQGVQQGIQQGEHKKQLEIAKRMKDNKINVKTIAEITGLSEEKIKIL